ncbi:MAG: S41 family peptidase [Sphingomonas phyllosphaerae]|uniref:S41 family peptidase n=1 Tax=Sphingomonas phyllosphaerae TaxID=257003 RepID=UPI002FFC3478
MIGIAVAGVFGQWLGWRLRLPAIIPLLAIGALLGPIGGLIHPSAALGEVMRPAIGMAVAIIVFEGGLNLNLRELRSAGSGIVRLVSVALPLNWLLGTLAGHWVAGLSWPVAILVGAILVTHIFQRIVLGKVPRWKRFKGRAVLALRIGSSLISTALALLATPTNATAAPIYDAVSLQADLRFALDTIEHQHPNVRHSVTTAKLEHEGEKVRRQLDHPMNQAEAWTTLAQLNPVLADGHLFIGLPDWRGQSAELIRQGTGFFPFEVRLDAEGFPVITATLGGAATPLAGRRIVRIDGRDARAIARALLRRVHGDTPAFRKALLAQRWWLFFAKLYGTPGAYDLVLSGPGKQHVVAGHALPAILQRDADFDQLFACRIDADGTAQLTVASFVWEDKARYLRFTHDCFSRVKAVGASRLVIDVSANGGGDDDMWKDGILRYIATRPYKQGSTYLKRERTGSVTAGSIETPTQPVADDQLHFKGKVTVLIGPLTYSSAVLFSNVVRDYGFGSLAGTGGAARTRQSGGVQSVKLPNTGLVLSYPRFVLDPPSGSRGPTYLQPDHPPQ